MAAAQDVSAGVSPTLRHFYRFFSHFFILQIVFFHLRSGVLCLGLTYSPEELKRIGFTARMDITRGFQGHKEIPEDIRRTPGANWIVYPEQWTRRERRKRQRRKRGRRGGIKIRLQRFKHKLGFPTGILANVRSLREKVDELRLLTNSPGPV